VRVLPRRFAAPGHGQGTPGEDAGAGGAVRSVVEPGLRGRTARAAAETGARANGQVG
jgi:hypothetical protein